MALVIPALAATGASATTTGQASGAGKAVAVKSGTLRAWGFDNDGQLGDGLHSNGSTLAEKVRLPKNTTVTSVRAGCAFTLALTSTGKVLAWGDDTFGQLGNGVTGGDRATPVSVKLPAGTKVTAIRAGCRHALALTSTGKVLAWGYNSFGQLGNNNPGTNSDVPVHVSLPDGTTVKAISAGSYHSLALTTKGEVLAWGRDDVGQLGDGHIRDTGVPVPETITMPGGVTVTGIAGGGVFSLALTSAGKALSWGDNTFGELGNNNPGTDSDVPVHVSPPGGTKIKGLFAGDFHVLALTTTGKVLAWGLNFHGQLGDDTTTAHSTPVQVHFTKGTTVAAVTASDQTSYALTAKGRVLAWGRGLEGEIGNGTASDSHLPARVQIDKGFVPFAIGTGPSAQHALAIVRRA